MKQPPFSLHFQYIYFPIRNAEVFLSFVSVVFHHHRLINLQPECEEAGKTAVHLGIFNSLHGASNTISMSRINV